MAEAEEKTGAEVEAEARADAEAEAEEKTEPEEEAGAEVEEKAEAEAEEEVGEEAEAGVEAEEKAEAETEEKAGAEAETGAGADAEAEAEEEVEVEAEAGAEAKVEAEAEAEEAKVGAEEGAEEKAEAETEEKTGVEAKAGAEAKAEAKVDAEEKAAATGDVDGDKEPAAGGVSETIQKMTRSAAVLPGESGHISLAMCAQDIMQRDLVWGSGDDSVQQALTKMQQADASYMMVGAEGVLEGLVSGSDIAGAVSVYLRPIFAKWRRPVDDATFNIKIKWIATRPVHTIRPNTSLAAIMENMCQFGVRALPVMDEQGKVQGLVTGFDVLRALLSRGVPRPEAGAS